MGFFGYGLSLVLFVLALRHLGTARTGAYFGVAPFFGAVLGWRYEPGSDERSRRVEGTTLRLGLWGGERRNTLNQYVMRLRRGVDHLLGLDGEDPCREASA